MGFIDFFRPSYRLSQGCPGCAARMAHIEDLQNLIKSERAGNALLQEILLQKAGIAVSAPVQAQEEMKPLRQMQNVGQLRRQAERREREAFPNARADYWARVRDEHERAGKLPDKEAPVVEVQKDA